MKMYHAQLCKYKPIQEKEMKKSLMILFDPGSTRSLVKT